MRFSFSLSSSLCMAFFLSHLGQALPFPRSELTPPSEDPFYSIPNNISHLRLGTVLRHRRIENIAAFSSLPEKVAVAYQMLYRTTDSHGKPTATVTTILVPYNANYSRVLSYQVAEDAAWLDCAPSYIFRRGADSGRGYFSSLVTQAELLLIDGALEQGWIVNAPDHLGYSAAFLADVQSGQAVLDSIRAVHQSRNVTGIHADPDVALWGYSGGSMATDFAAELLPSYAPDLRVIGAALGGTVPNITNSLNQLNKTPLAGLIPNGILGLTHQYPEVKELINEKLKPHTAAKFNLGASQCLFASIEEFFMEDIYDYFTDFETFLDNSVAQSTLSENDAGKTASPIPLFIYKAIHDEVSPIADTDALVKNFCVGGTPVTYHRDEFSEHLTLYITSGPDALMWLRDRFNGVPVSKECSTENVFTSLESKGAAQVLGKQLLAELKGLLGRPIGPNSKVRFQDPPNK